MLIFKDKILIKFNRNRNDPEKAILPALIYVNLNHNALDIKAKGFLICLGWWDFSIKFGIIFKLLNQNRGVNTDSEKLF